MKATKTLSSLPTVWIFEDQLSFDLPSLREAPADAPVLMIESAKAFSMWPYHGKRLAFLISAMRHFRDELTAAGRTVHYYALKPKGYLDSLSALRAHIKEAGSTEFWITDPSEYHTRAWLDTLAPTFPEVRFRYFSNTLFLTDREEFAEWARPLKSPLMEHFYRKMRVKHDVLMEDGKPIGGKWNLDKLNRKTPKGGLLIPPIKSFPPDKLTCEVVVEVNRRYPNSYGPTDGFDLPVTRKDAEAALEDFLDHRLRMFGDFEDAMVTGEPIMYHSRLSAAINAGLLSPMQCIRGAEDRFHKRLAPLNAAEGFIRQILGWREYMYGIYHSFMPEYRERNARKATRALPQLFWNAKTEMNCLKQTISAVVEHGYSHHIQRLMVICNFATLAGIEPRAVNDWFLAMYIDSHDWVVTPNVIGMGMNADGGTCATKPYVSSAAYINRMSDYCGGCKYNPAVRVSEDACPFNYLYWTFLSHFRKELQKNNRMAMMLKNLDRIPSAEMKQMMLERKQFIEAMQ